MKKNVLVLFTVSAFMFASCSKDDTTTTNPTNTNPTPTNTQGPKPPMPTPIGNNLSGALISIKMTYTTQPTGSPQPFDLVSEMGTAVFYDNPGSATKVEAGTVSLNSNNLEKQTDNTYFKWAYAGMTPSTLGLDNGSDWNITGSSAVTAFSYNDASVFPKYSGTIPASVTKANGVTLTFNSSTLTGADSVYVVIASGSQSVTKSYAKNAGDITISASDLSGLATVSNNTAILEICPVNYNELVKNGKNYVLIKEQAIVRNVNIN